MHGTINVISDEDGLQIRRHRKIESLVRNLLIIACKKNIAVLIRITVNYWVALCNIRDYWILVQGVVHVEMVNYVEEDVAKF